MKKLLNIPDTLYNELKEEAWDKRMNLNGYVISTLLMRKQGVYPAPEPGVKIVIDEPQKSHDLPPDFMNIKKEDIANGIELDDYAAKESAKSKWPTTKFGKPLSGKQERCTNCFEMCPIEFAQEHYMKEHGDV